jgi:hypothetical protein
VRKSGAQHITRLLDEGLVAGDQQAHELPLGDFDPNREQLREQAGRGDLSLMMLAEHEAAQLGAEMASDAGRHFRHQLAPVRRQPTFPPIAHNVLAKHQFLHDVVLITLEYRARRQTWDLEDPVFVDHAMSRLGAAASARQAGGRLGTVRLLHPGGLARRLDIGPALQSLQPRNLLTLLDNGLAQSRNPLEQFLDQGFELIARQRISINRVRHSENESGIRVLGNPPRPTRSDFLQSPLPGVLPLLQFSLIPASNAAPMSMLASVTALASPPWLSRNSLNAFTVAASLPSVT